MVTADTDLTPVDLGSYSSRVTLMTGNAAIQAARKRARADLRRGGEEARGARSSACAPADGRIWDAADPSQVARASRRPWCWRRPQHGTLGAVGSYTPPRSVAKWKGAGVGPTPTYSYSAAVVELSRRPRDRASSAWTRSGSPTTSGRSINPLLVIGQVEGSVYMGLGEALMEEQVFRKGLHKIPSMLDYKSPTTLEMPPVESILVETLDPEGPYGAKECGQGPLLPVIPAVANALLRRAGRARRRGADHAREGAGGARGPLPRAAHARRSRYPRDGGRAAARAAAPAAAPDVDPALRP